MTRRALSGLGLLSLVVIAGCGRDAAESPVAEVPSAPGIELAEYAVGGEFELTDQDGERFRISEARGKVVLLFFGYTSCPDVCPLTMSKLTQAFRALGPDAEKLLTVFISLDPERDTPERIESYLSFYGMNAVGLTGTKEEIDAVVDLHKTSYRVEPVDSATEYLISHSSYVYLIDQKGDVRYLFSHLDSGDQIAAGVRLLLD